MISEVFAHLWERIQGYILATQCPWESWVNTKRSMVFGPQRDHHSHYGLSTVLSIHPNCISSLIHFWYKYHVRYGTVHIYRDSILDRVVGHSICIQRLNSTSSRYWFSFYGHDISLLHDDVKKRMISSLSSEKESWEYHRSDRPFKKRRVLRVLKNSRLFFIWSTFFLFL